MHSRKELFLDFKSGELWREDDFYQSGKQCHLMGSDPGQLNPEELTITYNFKEARAGKAPWHCRVNGGSHYASSKDGEVTLEEAEAILKEWGLKRLGD
jgi:hypothetical protein